MKTDAISRSAQRSNIVIALCRILFGLLLLPGITGCKKDRGDSARPQGEYYLKFKVNGSQKMIDHAVIQGQHIESQTTDIYGKKVFFYSIGAAKSSGEMIGLGFVSQAKLTAPATFRESAGVVGTDKTATLTYNETLASINPLFSISTLDALNDYSSIARDGVVTITEYNNTYIKGTFSGTVYPANNNMEPIVSGKKVLTEGEFKLKLP